MKTSDVLRKAGDVLRELGWCQGEYSYYGQYCAVGAVRAVDLNNSYRPATLIGLVAGEESVSAALQFNDTKGRTAAEVMIALDAAYVVALQEEGIEPGDVL